MILLLVFYPTDRSKTTHIEGIHYSTVFSNDRLMHKWGTS